MPPARSGVSIFGENQNLNKYSPCERLGHCPGVFGCTSAAVVNQALAKSAPGLAPAGFHPHAFARPGLRAPLACGRKRPAHRPAGRFAYPSATLCQLDGNGWSRTPQCSIRRLALPATGFRGISSGDETALRYSTTHCTRHGSGQNGLTATNRRRRADHHRVRAPGRRSRASDRCAHTLKSVYFPLERSALGAAPEASGVKLAGLERRIR